jgi:hypothetical protein
MVDMRNNAEISQLFQVSRQFGELRFFGKLAAA